MPSKRSANQNDAITLLTADHRAVKAMFTKFEALKESANEEKRAQLFDQICSSLLVHMTIEEEIFYPAVRDATGDEEMMREAEVEHAGAKDLIAQLQTDVEGGAFDEGFSARVKTLAEMIDHHVGEEESEMFPKAQQAIDTRLVGAELKARKAELTEQEDEVMPAPSAPERPQIHPGLR